jgi:spermidine/putrescine transport system permease protein
MNGGFNGYISNLWYYNYALGTAAIQRIAANGPNTKMIGNVIESRYFKIVDYPTAAALSFTLMAAILILVTLYIRKAGTEELV